MTAKNVDRNPKDPSIEDLIWFHRYARARRVGQKLTASSFAESVDTTDELFKGVLTRLEKAFDAHLMLKRPKLVNEVLLDLEGQQHWEHFRASKREEWEAARKAEDESTGAKRDPGPPPAPPEYSIINKGRLTLAGEIFGEVASIFVGYMTIAKLGTKSGPNGYLAASIDLHRLLGWLQNERRRVHRLVVFSRNPEGSVFELGGNLSDDHFDAAQQLAIDVQDMSKVEIPPCGRYDDEEDEKQEDSPSPTISLEKRPDIGMRAVSRTPKGIR